MSDKTKGFEPVVTVVRQYGTEFQQRWCEDNGRFLDAKRAYLVRGLPMPGDKVRRLLKRDPQIVEVDGISVYVITNFMNEQGVSVTVPQLLSGDIEPHGPEAEMVERVRDAVREEIDNWVNLSVDGLMFETVARAAIAAMREES